MAANFLLFFPYFSGVAESYFSAIFSLFCPRPEKGLSARPLGLQYYQKNPRVRKILVRNSGARNGCANFMNTWKNAFFLQEKPMSIKLLVLGGGVFWAFWGGGYFGLFGGGADFIFMGARIFSDTKLHRLSGMGDSQRDSRESMRVNHSQLKPPMFIARQADSPESLEVPIRLNHPIRANRAN